MTKGGSRNLNYVNFLLGASKFSHLHIQSHSQASLLNGRNAEWSSEDRKIFNLSISGTGSDGIIKKKKVTSSFSEQSSWVQSWNRLPWSKMFGEALGLDEEWTWLSSLMLFHPTLGRSLLEGSQVLLVGNLSTSFLSCRWCDKMVWKIFKTQILLKPGFGRRSLWNPTLKYKKKICEKYLARNIHVLVK